PATLTGSADGPARLCLHSGSSQHGREGAMRRPLLIAVLAAAGVLAIVAVALGRGGDVLVAGSQSDVDYHAEGQIIGGNIQIQTDRAPDQGQALTRCDPDPRPAPHNRPDCAWATPNGNGREQDQL